MSVIPLLVLAACSSPKVAVTPGDAARGSEIYSTYCVACHQADGSGAPPNGKPIAGSFIGEDSVLAKPDETLLRVIASGTAGRIGSMPGWAGVLSYQDRSDVLAYLRKNFGTASEKAAPEE